MPVQAGNWIKFESTTDAFLAARGLREDLPARALYNTNKRVGAGIRKAVSKSVRDKWNIRAADVKAADVTPDTQRHNDVATVMSLTYKGKRISLRKFKPRQRGVQRGPRLVSTTRRIGSGETRKGASYQGIYESLRSKRRMNNTGVYAKIYAHKPAELIRAEGKYGSYVESTGEGPKAFIARGRAGRNNKTGVSGPPSNAAAIVFARRGKKRLPIDKLTVAAVPQMMQRPSVLKLIDQSVNERYGRELKHQLEFQINREIARLRKFSSTRATR